MNIKEIAIEDITPYWRNPRNNDKTVPALVKSIEKYGFNVPLILDNKNIIISGHTRFRAIKELGWDKVPCVIVDFTDKRAKKLRLLDNRIHELTEWNHLELDKEIAKIIGFNKTLGFFEGSLDSVFNITKEELDVDLTIEIGASESTKEETLVICPVCMEMTNIGVHNDL